VWDPIPGNPNGIWQNVVPVPVINISDGTSNTMLLFEQAGRPEYWCHGALQPGPNPANFSWWGAWAAAFNGPAERAYDNSCDQTVGICAVNCETQTIVGNSLACPYSLGVSAAAAFGAALAVVFGTSAVPLSAHLLVPLTASRGLSVAVTLHDLSLAARFADAACVLSNGSVCCAGTPADVLTEGMIASVYGVRAHISHDQQGKPAVTVLDIADPSEGGCLD
jgi:hypothetical protein